MKNLKFSIIVLSSIMTLSISGCGSSHTSSNAKEALESGSTLATLAATPTATIENRSNVYRVATYDKKEFIKPKIITLASGGFVLVWDVDNKVQRLQFDKDGKALGKIERVNEDLLDPVSPNAKVAPLSDGGYVIAWEQFAQDDADKYQIDIVVQRYDSSGNKIGQTTTINKKREGIQEDIGIYGLSDGGYVVTWVDKPWRKDHNVKFERFDKNGNLISDELNANTTTSKAITDPFVVELSDGGFVIFWNDRDKDFVYMQRFDKDSNRVAQEQRVDNNDRWELDQSSSSLEDGSFVVAWNEINGEYGYDIYLQEYDKDGNKIGDKIVANSFKESDQQESDVAKLNGGGFVVAWRSSGNDHHGIYMQKFDSSAKKVGLEQNVVKDTVDSRGFLKNSAEEPSVTNMSDGGYVVAYYFNGYDDYNSTLNLQRFDKDGNKIELYQPETTPQPQPKPQSQPDDNIYKCCTIYSGDCIVLGDSCYSDIDEEIASYEWSDEDGNVVGKCQTLSESFEYNPLLDSDNSGTNSFVRKLTITTISGKKYTKLYKVVVKNCQ